MICLTGDIHHSSLRTGNQQHCDIPEARVAARYLRMLEEARVHCTFFVSGRSFLEDWADVRRICESEWVEIGGHTWNCFEPAWAHRIAKKVHGSYNGPTWFQMLDIRRTREIARRISGRTIWSWRNHMYMHGENTDKALAQCGIRFCSDGVQADAMGPKWHPDGLFHFPINVIPDHEHLYHAERTPMWVANWRRRYGFRDDFGPESYYIDEWTDLVLDDLRRNEARGAVSNLIIHPITMYLCDGFRSFRRILDFIASKNTVQMQWFWNRIPHAAENVEWSYGSQMPQVTP